MLALGESSYHVLQTAILVASSIAKGTRTRSWASCNFRRTDQKMLSRHLRLPLQHLCMNLIGDCLPVWAAKHWRMSPSLQRQRCTLILAEVLSTMCRALAVFEVSASPVERL